ncbi:MAG TPA: 30S ribosomal protein S20 [Candidatus Polarisedimenticolaceae bacterium]|nr:30S ribosomal protein S20 [Candidatus Polarisedimenticolaceae bacterium]
MASHASAVKKNKQDIKRRLRNRAHQSRLRTQIKKVRQAVAAGDGPTAQSLMKDMIALVDRTAKHGVLHKNAAARTKSRLTRAVAKLSA